MENIVLLKAFYHKYEAEIAVGLLKDSGIEAILSCDDAGGFRQHLTLGMGNNRVLVRRDDLEQAREVLKTLDENLSEEELKKVEEIAVKEKYPETKHKPQSPRNIFFVLPVILAGAFLFSYVIQGTQRRDHPISKFRSGDSDCQQVNSGSDIYTVCKEYYQNKKVRSVINYKGDKADGAYMEFFESGGLRSKETYVDDKLNGPYFEYFESGSIRSEGVLKDDKSIGEFREYYETGELRRVANLKEDLFDGKYKAFYKSGKLMEDIELKNGIRFDPQGKPYEGEEKTLYESGALWEVYHYKQGKLNGLNKGYYENGNPEWESNYLSGLLEGKSKYFYPNGNIQFDSKYEKGHVVAVKEYSQDGRLIFQSDHH